MRKGRRGKKFVDSSKTAEGSGETTVEKHFSKIQHLNEKGDICEADEEPPKVLIKVPPSKPGVVCKLCFLPAQEEDSNLKLGPLFQFGYCCAHLYCLMFSSGLDQGGEDDQQMQGFLAEDIVKEWRRGSQLKCVYCKEKYATVGCVASKCNKSYHLPCGLKNGSLQLFFGSYPSHCDKHRPIQAILVSKDKKNKTEKVDNSLVIENCCGVCLEELEEKPTPAVLWTPCCGGWFHRSCIERMAETAGCHFFKCPLCNNKKKFEEEMVQFGIYVPDQDAVWETEPGAFDDQYERHGRCDAELCLCPEGRTKDVDWTEWEVMLCYCCGSQGIHVTCGGLNLDNPRWKCDFCKDIVKNLPNKPISVFNNVNHKTAGVFYQETGKLVVPAKENVENLLKRMTFTFKEDHDNPEKPSDVTRMVQVDLRKGHRDHEILAQINVDLLPAFDVPEQVKVRKEDGSGNCEESDNDEEGCDDSVIVLEEPIVKEKDSTLKRDKVIAPEYLCEFCDSAFHSKKGLKLHIHHKHSNKENSRQISKHHSENNDNHGDATVKRKRGDSEDLDEPIAKITKTCSIDIKQIDLSCSPKLVRDKEDFKLDTLSTNITTPLFSTPKPAPKTDAPSKNEKILSTPKSGPNKNENIVWTPKAGTHTTHIDSLTSVKLLSTPKSVANTEPVTIEKLFSTPKSATFNDSVTDDKISKIKEMSKTPGSSERSKNQPSIKSFFQKAPTECPKNQPSIMSFFKKTPTNGGSPGNDVDSVDKSPILRNPLATVGNVVAIRKVGERPSANVENVDANTNVENTEAISKGGEKLSTKAVRVNLAIINIPKNILDASSSDNKDMEDVIELDREFICDACQKSFSDENSLQRHRLSHSGVKFQCKFCKISFTTALAWKKHEISHEDVKFKCAICDASFQTEKSLSSHNKKSHEKAEKDEKSPKAKTNFCELCDFSTGYKSYLKKHVEKMHAKKNQDNLHRSGDEVLELLENPTGGPDKEKVEAMDESSLAAYTEDATSGFAEDDIKQSTKLTALLSDWDNGSKDSVEDNVEDSMEDNVEDSVE